MSLSIVLLLVLSATIAAQATLQQNNHHREKRALPKLALLAYKSGGSGASPLPPHIDPNIGQSSAQLNALATTASMSGPFAVLGILHIIGEQIRQQLTEITLNNYT